MGDNGSDLVWLVGPLWSAAEVRDALGLISEEAPDDRIRAAEALALTTSDGQLILGDPLSDRLETARRATVSWVRIPRPPLSAQRSAAGHLQMGAKSRRPVVLR